MKLPFTQIPVYFSFMIFAVLPVATQQSGCKGKIKCPNLTMPAPGSVDVLVNTDLIWDIVGGDSIRYNVTIDTGGVLYFQQDGLSVNQLNLSDDLPPGTEISVTLAAVNAKGQTSQKCGLYQFTTAALLVPPTCTQINQPEDGDTEVAQRPFIRWDKVPGATSYILRAGTSAANWDIIDSLDVGDVAEFSAWASPFSFEQEIHVLVIPKNESGQAEGCQTISFTVKKEPEPPAAPSCSQLKLTSPATATNVSLDSPISWEGATGLIHGYKLKMVNVNGGEELVNEEIITAQPDASFTPAIPLPENQQILLTIIPFNEANGRQEAVGCQEFRFTTKAVSNQRQSECATITFPGNGANGISLSDTIRWKAASGNPSGYHLQAGTTDSTFNLFDKKLGNVLSYPAYFLFYDSTTFLRITPYDAIGNPTGNCTSIRFTTGSRPADAPNYIRRNMTEMPPGHPHLETYKRGVKLLKELPSSDPFSWNQQAHIHGSGKCQHSLSEINLYFLPWHRAYIFYLEEIIREVTGAEDFALPYWNWTTHTNIPDAFWGGSDNPLFHSERRANETTTSWIETTNPNNIQIIHDNIAFGAFSRELEAGPHNTVHRGIGRDMVSTARAARDPIFYCHHANVDRLWAEWNEDPDPGKGNNPTDNAWLENQQIAFTDHFITREKQSVDIKNKDLVSTRSQNLNYRYDTQKEVLEAPALNAFESKKYYVDHLIDGLTFDADTISVANTNSVVEWAFKVTNSEFFKRVEDASETRADQTQFRFIKLLIEGIHPPPEDAILVRVFINCDYLNVNIPPTDPHYVTAFSFFQGGEGGHQGHQGHGDGYNFLIDLTETLRKLKDTDSFPNEENGLRVQLIALPAVEGELVRPYRPGKVKVGLVVAREFIE